MFFTPFLKFCSLTLFTYKHLIYLFRGRSWLKRGRFGLSWPHEDEGQGGGQEVAEEGQDTGNVSVEVLGSAIKTVCYTL